MSRHESGHVIDEAAAQWVARIDRAPLSPEDERALDLWLAADVRRRGAFARANAIMVHADRARALAGGAQHLQDNARSRRWFLLAGAGAAAASIGAVWLSRRSRDQFMQLQTAKGGMRNATLSDGSQLTLNTATSVQVDFSPARRELVMASGEAEFDVSKDTARPFIVRVGPAQVRGMGTRFTIRYDPDLLRVFARKGVVEVSDAGDSTPMQLTTGMEASLDLDPAKPVNAPPIVARRLTEAEIARCLAWREGKILFAGLSLADAAAEFYRYSPTRIVIDDPQLARETITGQFEARDPRAFANAVAISLNAKVTQADGEIHLYR